MLKCYERQIMLRVPRFKGRMIYRPSIEFFLSDDQEFVDSMNYKKKIKYIVNENPPITQELYRKNWIYTRPILDENAKNTK